MDTVSKAKFVAQHLTTEYQSKKHGGYDIYRDDKIEISYDTYYPNVHVYVIFEEKKELVLLHSGHGYNQEYHPGEWEKYISETLYPRAIEAKKEKDTKRAEREAKERQERFGAIDDSKVFGA